jgi:hypothetical protein
MKKNETLTSAISLMHQYYHFRSAESVGYGMSKIDLYEAGNTNSPETIELENGKKEITSDIFPKLNVLSQSTEFFREMPTMKQYSNNYKNRLNEYFEFTNNLGSQEDFLRQDFNKIVNSGHILSIEISKIKHHYSVYRDFLSHQLICDFERETEKIKEHINFLLFKITGSQYPESDDDDNSIVTIASQLRYLHCLGFFEFLKVKHQNGLWEPIIKRIINTEKRIDTRLSVIKLNKTSDSNHPESSEKELKKVKEILKKNNFNVD